MLLQWRCFCNAVSSTRLYSIELNPELAVMLSTIPGGVVFNILFQQSLPQADSSPWVGGWSTQTDSAQTRSSAGSAQAIWPNNLLTPRNNLCGYGRMAITTSKRRDWWQANSLLFRTSSSDTDCILTFSLGFFVPTLRRFCHFMSTIYDMIWYDYYRNEQMVMVEQDFLHARWTSRTINDVNSLKAIVMKLYCSKPH